MNICALIGCPAIVIADLPIDEMDALLGISTVSGCCVVTTSMLFGRSLTRRIESVAPLSTMGLTVARFALLCGVVGTVELLKLLILLLCTTLTGLVSTLMFVPTPPRQAMRYPGVRVVFPSFPLILVGLVALRCSGE